MKNNADKTSELLASLSTIHSKEDFEAYLNTHTQTEFSFSQYYNSILHCKNISLAEAVKNSTLERHYAYQIVNGTRDAIIIKHINTEDFSVANINDDLYTHDISPLLS